MIWENDMNRSARQPPYLKHYGVKGQKWGLRRYQNEDGTLTEEGRRRYGTGSVGRDGDIVRKTSNNEREIWRKSDAEDLSDDELNRRNSRLQREQQYKNMVTSDSERNRQQFINEIKKDAIKKIILGGAISLAAVAMKGHWAQAASFIGKNGKKLFASIKSSSMFRNIGKRNANAFRKYTNPAVTLKAPNRMFNFSNMKSQATARSFSNSSAQTRSEMFRRIASYKGRKK